MVYIIDQDPSVSQDIVKILEKSNYQTKVFSSSKDLVSSLSSGECRCVIAEISLVGINGIELSDFIKKHFPEIKVAVTTNLCELLRDEVKKTGADRCFRKPFNPNDLLSWVEKEVDWENAA